MMWQVLQLPSAAFGTQKFSFDVEEARKTVVLNNYYNPKV
jgi:hypothetical protein